MTSVTEVTQANEKVGSIDVPQLYQEIASEYLRKLASTAIPSGMIPTDIITSKFEESEIGFLFEVELYTSSSGEENQEMTASMQLMFLTPADTQTDGAGYVVKLFVFDAMDNELFSVASRKSEGHFWRQDRDEVLELLAMFPQSLEFLKRAV